MPLVERRFMMGNVRLTVFVALIAAVCWRQLPLRRRAEVTRATRSTSLARTTGRDRSRPGFVHFGGAWWVVLAAGVSIKSKP